MILQLSVSRTYICVFMLIQSNIVKLLLKITYLFIWIHGCLVVGFHCHFSLIMILELQLLSVVFLCLIFLLISSYDLIIQSHGLKNAFSLKITYQPFFKECLVQGSLWCQSMFQWQLLVKTSHNRFYQSNCSIKTSGPFGRKSKSTLNFIFAFTVGILSCIILQMVTLVVKIA